MENKLKKHFILFAMLIISIVLSIFTILIFLGGENRKPPQALFLFILLAVVMTYVAGSILSRFALAPIKKTWQQQLDFTADASHELRTPLAVIQTNLELVLDNPNESVESQHQWLKNIQDEAKSMSLLVENLLTLSRADTNEQNLDFTSFNFDEVVRHSLIPLIPTAQANNNTIDFNLKSSYKFYGDEQRIAQLCIILTDNALKYMGNSKKFLVSTYVEKGTLILSVEDNGHGIPKKDLPYIFHRFYRCNDARNDGGSGLGLSIAKWIVSSHKGTINASSIPNEKTIFTIALPTK